MKLKELTRRLDKEFAVQSSSEDLTQWAVTGHNRDLIDPDFLEGKTGLMVSGSDTIHSVRTAVFVTDHVVLQLSELEPCLLFSHHNFDYYEDERGLQAIRPDQIEKVLHSGHSIYVAHAPLDTHPVYGTSLALAETVGITTYERFYDYFGAPAALAGITDNRDFKNFSESVREKLKRPKVDTVEYRPHVDKIAVVAGGGDIPDLLQEAHDMQCDTLLLGTLEHRWALPAVQESHEQFLKLNENLQLNLIGGSHFGTERPAMIRVLDLFRNFGISCEYCEDEELLNAL
jgi:putative NIF3 family GTP cyclohydrolase 1 type 2